MSEIKNKTIIISVDYEIGDKVYLITDIDQNVGLVIGYEVSPLGVCYTVTFDKETKIYQSIELSYVKTIF